MRAASMRKMRERRLSQEGRAEVAIVELAPRLAVAFLRGLAAERLVHMRARASARNDATA